eukprot:2847976-Amphidinium_carterae.1
MGTSLAWKGRGDPRRLACDAREGEVQSEAGPVLPLPFGKVGGRGLLLQVLLGCSPRHFAH